MPGRAEGCSGSIGGDVGVREGCEDEILSLLCCRTLFLGGIESLNDTMVCVFGILQHLDCAREGQRIALRCRVTQRSEIS